MPRNERLAALMTEAGFLDRTGAIARKRFARAASESPSARAASRSYSHTYVGRWLDGVVPRDSDTRDAIREALGAQLGRVVALDELGFPRRPVSPDAGLTYPDTPRTAQAPSRSSSTPTSATPRRSLHAPPNMAAWNDAAMAWLVGAQHPIAENGGPRRIGLADVDRLRTMRVTFDRLDSTYGGAHARNALVQYLRTELPAAAARRRHKRRPPRAVLRRGRVDPARGVDGLRRRTPRLGAALLHPGPRPGRRGRRPAARAPASSTR